jgi:hypothetical protein
MYFASVPRMTAHGTTAKVTVYEPPKILPNNCHQVCLPAPTQPKWYVQYSKLLVTLETSHGERLALNKET